MPGRSEVHRSTGEGGVAQVVGPPGEGSGGEFGAEGGGAGVVPGAAVGRFAEYAAAGAGEEPPVGCGAVLGEVPLEEGDQDGRDGDGPDGAGGAVFEAA